MPKIRVGALNAQYGHAPSKHAEKIIRIFDSQDLDVLLITESRDYNRVLSELARKKGYKLVVHRVRQGSDQCTALVRDPSKLQRSFTFTAGRGWFRRGGGTMAPMQPIAIRYNGAWFVGVHAPVQAWVATRSGRKWIGSLTRRLAYRGFVVRLASFAGKRQGPLVMLGDWNANPTTSGRWSPNWLRDKINGKFARPFVSTGHGEIDFGITRGMHLRGKVNAYFPNDFPGDHKFLWMVLEY